VCSYSTIWDENEIVELNKNKKSTQEINKIRSNYFIPGTELNTLESFSKVPILLIQNSSSNSLNSIWNRNMYSGWDIVLPRSWAMPFWLPLIHLGCRGIGQSELDYLLFESGFYSSKSLYR
jgi:ribonuclease P/MRP protein subunit POP1